MPHAGSYIASYSKVKSLKLPSDHPQIPLTNQSSKQDKARTKNLDAAYVEYVGEKFCEQRRIATKWGKQAIRKADARKFGLLDVPNLLSCLKYAEPARANKYLIAACQRCGIEASRLNSISMNSLLASRAASTRTTEPMARTSLKPPVWDP